MQTLAGVHPVCQTLIRSSCHQLSLTTACCSADSAAAAAGTHAVVNTALQQLAVAAAAVNREVAAVTSMHYC
jgi:hypothetical protein